ncbi:MAG: hypothetical protein DMF99_29790 [Acidobacteria bacterium]|nr:MAG: hypothetical protein DMF99_29790 [Acidobacteriota bacterium]
MSVNTVLRARQSATFAGAATVCVQPLRGFVSEISIRRSGCVYGSGRSRTARTTVNIEVTAPMPTASVRMTTKVNPGFLRNVRSAYLTSCSAVSTSGRPRRSCWSSRVCVGPPNRRRAVRRASSSDMPRRR